MKKIVFSNGKEIELPDDVQFVDDEAVTPDDFSDIVAIRREERKHEVRDKEGMIWR